MFVKKLSPSATLPTRGSQFAAGYDLYASHDETVLPGYRSLISTDIAIAIPSGHYARIAPRSGLAWKNGIMVGAGVVDEDYRGEVKVMLFNLGGVDFEVKKGDRIAQLILEKIATPEVKEVEELPETKRGEGGFGSTGK